MLGREGEYDRLRKELEELKKKPAAAAAVNDEVSECVRVSVSECVSKRVSM